MRDSPNFLLIITDQQRADYLGCSGHPVLRTPNIDSIAADGVRFERFYVSTPVCMPNRSTLMTGRMPSIHGVRHNGIPLSRSAATFVELLRADGYRTALIGKSHLQTQTGRPPLSKPDPAPDGCGSIACIDNAVGRMLAALRDSGLDETTIVIFTSDHGEHLGDHKLLLKGLCHYDELLRVPFIWSDPQRGAKGEVTQAISGTIDLSATILDRAKLQPYYGMQGRSFLTIIDDPSAPHRSEMLIEDENQRSVAGLGPRPRERTIVTDRWRLSIFCGHEWGELYDLKEDPGEYKNLWDVPAHQKTKAQLMRRLAHNLMSVCDRSPAPLHQA